jgi:hypothetical protein
VQSAVLQILSEEDSSLSSFSSSSSLPTLSSELKSHLASCGSCASLARALDPTLLLLPLGAPFASAPAAEDARRVAEDVLAEVRRRARVAAPAPTRALFSRRFLQAAALVALAAGLLGVQGIRIVKERTALSAAKTPTAAPGFVAGSESEAALAAARAVRPSSRPLIQDLKNPSARVYEFAAVSMSEPSVVFIADPHADL